MRGVVFGCMASSALSCMNAFQAGLQSAQGSARESYLLGRSLSHLVQVQIHNFECKPLAHSPWRELPEARGLGVGFVGSAPGLGRGVVDSWQRLK